MKIVKTVLISIVSLAILVAGAFYIIGRFSPQPGGIRIETTPSATVFINGNLAGSTPYKSSYETGEIVLRLVPQGSSENLLPFETKITLEPGIETVVGRNFAATETNSSGYIISFKKNKAQTTGLAVISDPTNAQVMIDGVSRGFSPYNSSNIAPAMHTVTIKSPGYKDFSMTIKTLTGYTLSFYAKLGKGENDDLSKNKETLNPVKTVKILDTPTGYLRVRSKPGSGGEEIAQVEPGDTFPYLGIDVASGWIQIQYEASKSGLPSGLTGWISDKYATISSTTKEN